MEKQDKDNLSIDNPPDSAAQASTKDPAQASVQGKRKGRSAIWLAVGAGVLIVLAGYCGWLLFGGYGGQDRWVKISRGSSDEKIHTVLCDSLGGSYGNRVYWLWHLAGSSTSRAGGAYLVAPGTSPLALARRLRNGAQTPVSLVLPGVRTMDRLARKVGEVMEITPEEFLAACDSVLGSEGYLPQHYPAAFLPDKYEMYWNTPATSAVRRLLGYRDRFWNEERLAKARRLGLTEVEVATLASIVEEETAKTDERPKVARLYLNRLQRHIKLQADPTVKFSTGDFSLRRITGVHLATPSDYNTYLHEGLPPGPIRIVEKQTIDGVLDAPAHDYIFMCAREDFSGYHNFAVDYATHMANARRYQAELNRRNIH